MNEKTELKKYFFNSIDIKFKTDFRYNYFAWFSRTYISRNSFILSLIESELGELSKESNLLNIFKWNKSKDEMNLSVKWVE